jgi:hypothetical protein
MPTGKSEKFAEKIVSRIVRISATSLQPGKSSAYQIFKRRQRINVFSTR